MTPSKYKLAVESQTAIARKIFDNVPIAEPWTVQKIMSEMTRMGSTRVDLRTAEGCLNHLKDAGLVKEPQRGLFQRVVPREQLTVSAPMLEAASVVPLPSAALPNLAGAIAIAKSAHDEARATAVLGELASKLRAQGELLLELAEELEESAIAMEERIDLAEKRATKFRELSALLKGLNEE